MSEVGVSKLDEREGDAYNEAKSEPRVALDDMA